MFGKRLKFTTDTTIPGTYQSRSYVVKHHVQQPFTNVHGGVATCENDKKPQNSDTLMKNQHFFLFFHNIIFFVPESIFCILCVMQYLSLKGFIGDPTSIKGECENDNKPQNSDTLMKNQYFFIVFSQLHLLRSRVHLLYTGGDAIFAFERFHW